LIAGGHYTTYALNYVNLSWYEYDDQIVTEVDPQQVENCEAYVLFYRFLLIFIFSYWPRVGSWAVRIGPTPFADRRP